MLQLAFLLSFFFAPFRKLMPRNTTHIFALQHFVFPGFVTPNISDPRTFETYDNETEFNETELMDIVDDMLNYTLQNDSKWEEKILLQDPKDILWVEEPTVPPTADHRSAAVPLRGTWTPSLLIGFFLNVPKEY